MPAPDTLPEDPLERAVSAFQGGEDREASFRRIVEGGYHPVRAFLSRRVPSSDDALELTQETFLRIYRGLEGFRREASFLSWALRIAHTTYLQWLARRKRLPEPLANGSPTDSEDEAPAIAEPPRALEDVLRREASARLREAVAALPEQERRCMTLRVYQDLSHQEIADFLGLQVGTVKAHLHHAKQKLRARLAETLGSIDF